MQEKSMTRNHGFGIIGIEIIETESSSGETSRRHPASIWEACGRHLGGIREASERHPGGIWEASGRHLGAIWEASGRHLGLQAAMGLQEAANHKKRCPSQLQYKSSLKF
jgi:hypothetical protein